MVKRIVTINTEHVKGYYWRGIPEMFALTPLENGPNFIGITRYSMTRRFTALYFSSSLELSKKELDNKLDGDGEAIIFTKYLIDIEDIVDLTKPSIRESLQVTLDDIVKPRFEPGAYNKTHQIAKYIYENRLNGILVPSSHDPENREWFNLVLYPANIIRGYIKEED